MFYDPVGDRFVVKNKVDGSIGVTLHESPNWDTLSSANVNIGTGNMLELMGLVTPQTISDVYSGSKIILLETSQLKLRMELQHIGNQLKILQQILPRKVVQNGDR